MTWDQIGLWVGAGSTIVGFGRAVVKVAKWTWQAIAWLGYDVKIQTYLKEKSENIIRGITKRGSNVRGSRGIQLPKKGRRKGRNNSSAK